MRTLFSQGSSHASIIARQLPAPPIRLLAQRRWWNELSDAEAPDLPLSVDWLDRQIVIVFGPEEDYQLPLNLVGFELTMRAGEGVGFRKFFRADLRRILSKLAFLAESRSEEEGEIRMMLGSDLRRISLDVGNQIRVGRS